MLFVGDIVTINETNEGVNKLAPHKKNKVEVRFRWMYGA